MGGFGGLGLFVGGVWLDGDMLNISLLLFEIWVWLLLVVEVCLFAVGLWELVGFVGILFFRLGFQRRIA